MNILHITPDFNYSDGRSYYVYLLLKYLKRNGHNVYLCTNAGDSFNRLKDEDIEYYVRSSLTDKLSLLKSVKYISDIVKKHKIEIIHSHHRYCEIIANAVSMTLNRNIKTVFTALSIVDKRYKVEYKSDLIIAVSRTVKEMLKSRFKLSDGRIIQIPNFTDTEEIDKNNSHPFKERKSGADDINILSVGRFHKDKDFMTLLKALLKTESRNLNLTLIGEGSDKESYSDFISIHGLRAEIIPPQKDLRKYYENADMCILPSVRDPFPGFMLQSGLHSKPFIGSDTDGIAELINNGANGLLFLKKNPDDLAAKIDLFVRKKLLAENCALNLHRKIMSNYTERQIIPEIEHQYVKLIKKTVIE